MQARIKVLDASGHTMVPIDTDDEAAVKEAERIVEDAFRAHSMVVDQKTEEKIPTVRDYSPTEHPDVIIVPQFQGG